MSDLISRRAAINAIGSMFAPTPTQKDMVEDCLEIIENLPSAEPTTGELVRCKDCDWWEKSDNSLQGRCARYGFYPTGEYYCAGAEPKGEDE